MRPNVWPSLGSTSVISTLNRRLAPGNAFEVDDARDTPAGLDDVLGKGLGEHRYITW